MALAIVASGSQTVTLGTEHTLATSTTGKTYVLGIDLTPLTGSEIMEFRIYTKALPGGTERLAYVANYWNWQTTPVKYSPPVPANVHIRASMKLVSGSGQAYDWILLSID